MPLGMEVDGDQAPPKKGGGAPSQIFAHCHCGQTAGCVKMPLGMEVRQRPEDFVFDGDQNKLKILSVDTTKSYLSRARQ